MKRKGGRERRRQERTGKKSPFFTELFIVVVVHVTQSLLRFTPQTRLTHLPRIGQDDFLAGASRWCALGLFHGHQVADIS